MAFYRVDTLIRHLRLAKGLSQEQLAKGICARDTLSRIERGMRKPDWYIFERLMQRLGEDPKKYWQGLVSATDWKILQSKKEIDCLLKRKRYLEASTLLNNIENDGNFKECFNRQFVIRVKAELTRYVENDNELSTELALQAIHMTIPDFDTDKIDLYVLSFEEINLVTCLAANSCHSGDINRALDMLLKLKTAVDKNYMDDDEKDKTYPLILYNITKYAMKLERYDLVLDICDQGLAYCKTCNEAYFPAHFLCQKAFSYLYTDNRRQGRAYIRQALALFKAQERDEEVEDTILKAKEMFDVSLRAYAERI